MLLLISLGTVQATTIIPFPNLGEMANASQVVVLAKATRNYEVNINNATRYRTQFSIVNEISGQINDGFSTQNMRLKRGDLNRSVFGDMEFEEGATYLLFLENRGDYWRPIMMSHGIFQKFERDGKALLSPVKEGLNYFTLRRPDGQEVEPFYVYDLKKMVKLLRKVTKGEQAWNSNAAKTDYPIDWFQAATRAEPAHCTFIGDPAPFARWTDFPATPLPVHYSSAGDPGCPTANAKVQSVIGSLNANYTGLNLTDGGTHGFVPSCGGGEGANDNEFTTWVGATLGGTRHLVVQYDDPCDEIADLVGCNGTLAFGGFYWFGSTHVWDGTNWNPGAYGYVVVNNGTGTCQCPSTDYDIMMTHEITHALGIGHIASATGAANMNPSCCESIAALDIECLDYTYTPVTLPVELLAFSGHLVDKTSHLKWATASEENNDFFTLERSIDGERFEAIGKINGKGSTTQEQQYHFVDEQPRLGKNYYRLSQTDFDGRNEVVGDIVVIEHSNEGIISVQPNPIRANEINLILVAERGETMELQIFDMNGRVVQNGRYQLNKGRNELKLQADDLSSGVYLLKAVVDGKVQSHRILKTK